MGYIFLVFSACSKKLENPSKKQYYISTDKPHPMHTPGKALMSLRNKLVHTEESLTNLDALKLEASLEK